MSCSLVLDVMGHRLDASGGFHFNSLHCLCSYDFPSLERGKSVDSVIPKEKKKFPQSGQNRNSWGHLFNCIHLVCSHPPPPPSDTSACRMPQCPALRGQGGRAGVWGGTILENTGPARQLESRQQRGSESPPDPKLHGAVGTSKGQKSNCWQGGNRISFTHE